MPGLAAGGPPYHRAQSRRQVPPLTFVERVASLCLQDPGGEWEGGAWEELASNTPDPLIWHTPRSISLAPPPGGPSCHGRSTIAHISPSVPPLTLRQPSAPPPPPPPPHPPPAFPPTSREAQTLCITLAGAAHRTACWSASQNGMSSKRGGKKGGGGRGRGKSRVRAD
ncbi:unnamed protein product [Arctogadus glacialis]